MHKELIHNEEEKCRNGSIRIDVHVYPHVDGQVLAVTAHVYGAEIGSGYLLMAHDEEDYAGVMEDYYSDLKHEAIQEAEDFIHKVKAL